MDFDDRLLCVVQRIQKEKLTELYFFLHSLKMTHSLRTAVDDFISIHLAESTSEDIKTNFSDPTSANDMYGSLSQVKLTCL